MKVLCIRYNLFVGIETLSLSVCEPIVIQTLLGGTVPQFGRGVELGGRVWYPVKFLHISYNLFAGTDMLSLTVYEPIAIQILLLETVPNLGEGVELWGRVWYPVKAHHDGISYLFKPIRYLASFRSHTPCKFWVWGTRPPNWGKGWGQKLSHSKV